MQNNNIRLEEHFLLDTAIARCPECGTLLDARIIECDPVTCIPTEVSLHCIMEKYDETKKQWNHNRKQSDWQPVKNCVLDWCARNVRVTER